MAPNPRRQECEDCTPVNTDVLNQIRSDIAELKTAVIGNEKLGMTGIVPQLAQHRRFIAVIILLGVALGGERVVAYLF